MIPADLAAFRALMGAVAETLNNKSCFCGSIDEGERLRDLEAQCNALATATPAQLCGIVQEHVDEMVSDAWSAGYVAATDDT